MTFDLRKLGKTSVTGANAPLIWSYDAGDDSKSTYTADGYFNGAFPSIGKGHLIYVNSNTDYALVQVTASKDVNGNITTKAIYPPVAEVVYVSGITDIDHGAGNASLTHTVLNPIIKPGDYVSVSIYDRTDLYIVRVQAADGNFFFQTSTAIEQFKFTYTVISPWQS